MRWVWPLVGGVVMGGASSVLPSFELGVPLAFIGAFGVVLAGALRGRSPWFTLKVSAVTWLFTVVVCVALPFKYADRKRVSLNAECVSVAELADAVHARDVVSDPTRVCFEDRTPTLRAVQQALKQQTHAELVIGYCGTGASFLYGMHPVGGVSIKRP